MKKVKFIRVFSDIHLDFDVARSGSDFEPNKSLWFPKSLKTDHETILIIAGDLWHAHKPFDFQGYSWLKEVCKRFLAVVVVLGNHDFWGGNIKKEYKNFELQKNKQKIENLFLLQNNIVRLGDIKFVGGTLWTGYGRGDIVCMDISQSFMNDFKHIKGGNILGKIKPQEIYSEHEQTYKHIKSNCVKEFADQKIWVVTHHSPTFRSLYQNHKNIEGQTQEDCFYASNIENLINNDINVWVHGHIHKGNYYKIEDTRIISNPRGYFGENKIFNEDVVFDTNGNIIKVN